MNWEEHKEKLVKATEVAFVKAFAQLTDQDKICSLNYWLSQDGFINIMLGTLACKEKFFDEARKRTFYSGKPIETLYTLSDEMSIKEYFEEFNSISFDEIIEEDFRYSEEYKNAEGHGEFDQYTQEVIIAAEAQLALKTSNVLQHEKVSDCIDLLIGVAQNDVIFNGILRK